MFKIFYLEAKTISDAWFQLIYNLFDYGYFQDIQSGSFEGERRRQFPGASFVVEMPWLDIVPVIPEGMGIPSPTTMDYINDYFANYLMDPILGRNEVYKYSSRIHSPMPKGGTQFERVLGMLKKTPLTNQAVIEIASPVDFDICIGKDNKLDPHCLRLIDFKVIPVDGKMVLTVTVYFRSWDLWAGLPTNLGGIELLKQYVASEAGLENGPMYAYSAGLHLYGYQEEIAKIRTMKK